MVKKNAKDKANKDVFEEVQDTVKKPGVVDTLIISALGKLSQDLCHEFEASLDHITNLCLKINKDKADPVG